MKKYISIIILILFSQTVFSQQSVTGNITDSVGNPIEGVIITVKNTVNKTTSDRNGNYLIILPSGFKTLTFEKSGFTVREVEIHSNIVNVTMGNTDTNLFDLSLEDLMKINIVTASKKSVSLAEAPAIISVITRKEIEEKGYQSLMEILTTIAGVNAIETYWGFNQLFFRGVYSTLYNDKTLVLINGHPFWDAVNGSHYIETFPLLAIEKIEVIRGPGSTLYGTNAYSGVINIITTSDKKIIEHTSAYIHAQNSQNYDGAVSIGSSKGDIEWMVSLQTKGGKGYDFVIPELEGNKTNVNYNYINNFNSIFSKINFKNFSFDLYAFDQNKSKIDAAPFAWGTLNQTHNNFKGIFYGLSFQKELSDKFSIMMRSSYNNVFRVFNSRYSTKYARYESVGSRTDAEINLTYSPNEKINFLVGYQYEYLFADYYNFIDENTDEILAYGFGKDDRIDNINSVFLQGDIKLLDQLSLIAGVRYSYNKYYKSSINPRGGIVYKATENLYFKLFYGNAFRAPNFFEKYWNFGTTFGTENLSTEKINTYEMSVEFTSKSFSSKVNYFYNVSTDIISRELQPDNTTKYINIPGNSITQGIEAELKFKYRFIDLYFNGSYIKPKDIINDDIKYYPSILFNTGIIFTIKNFSSHLFMNYTDKTINTVKNIDYTINAISLLNLKLSYNFPYQLCTSLIINNIFDQDVWAPEFIRRNIVQLPNGPGRTITLELRKKF